MFITRDQKERDSATAYRTPAAPAHVLVASLCVCFTFVALSLSGMTVEVLGTLLGTAIQGQIVGGASVCSSEPHVSDSGNSSVVNTSSVSSLSDTVRWFASCRVGEL